MIRIQLTGGSSWLAILAAQGVICAGAAADPITITETINLNQDLSAGNGSYAGTFNINSLLPGIGNYTDPLQILSASVEAYGYSSPNPTTVYGAYGAYQQTSDGGYYYPYTYVTSYGYNQSYTYSYSCGWAGWDTCYSTGYYWVYSPTYATAYYYVPDFNETEYRTVTNLDNTTDTAAVTTGSDTFSGSDSTHTVQTVGTEQTYLGENGNYGDSEYYDYENTTTVDDYLYGTLSAGGSLSTTSLLELAAAGTLPFQVDATNGQFDLSQLTLTVTLNQSASVPEPGTLSIFGFSLLVLALRARSIHRPEHRG